MAEHSLHSRQKVHFFTCSTSFGQKADLHCADWLALVSVTKLPPSALFLEVFDVG